MMAFSLHTVLQTFDKGFACGTRNRHEGRVEPAQRVLARFLAVEMHVPPRCRRVSPDPTSSPSPSPENESIGARCSCDLSPPHPIKGFICRGTDFGEISLDDVLPPSPWGSSRTFSGCLEI
ncbi:unnamed protein product [Heligmosomoides polygyrus]|uniref:Uncharacterized protein n=1 Tax=Heligmosomoides polygyrus TaxID=6339 RepID=A0A3P8F7B0_HELPZ|nr:unnamed protein product [Heligmosomoides polygyrus]